MALYDKILGYLIKHNIKGKDRIYSLMKKSGARTHITSPAKYGIKLFLNPNEYIDSIVIKESFYESEITDEILKQLENGGTFWDIGANIGIHSIAVKKMLPGTKVYSFEPNPRTLGYLYDNVKLNNLDINVCGFALFDRTGPMTLHLVDGNSGMTTLTPWHEINFTSATKCFTTTGDTLLNEEFTAPSVIKIDTEGSELGVLKGCKNILLNPGLKAILFEEDNNLLTEPQNNKVAQYLHDFGFTQIRKLQRSENTHHGLSNFVATKQTA